MEDKAALRRTCCQTLGKAFKGEFKRQNLGFSGANYELFPFSQWMRLDTHLYPIYRFIIAIGLLAWACVEIPLRFAQNTDDYTKYNYFLYVTNWSFLLYTLSSNAFAIFCTFYNCKKALGSCLKHSIPGLTVVLDVCINGLPIRLLHAIYPMIYGIIYSTFSYFYFAGDNVRPIYSVLDWSKPGKAAFVCLMITLFGLVVQFLLFLLYVGRITLSAHLNGRGKVVVERWWNESSQATPVKEVIKDIEAVEFA
ncbi:unnamed protein product [Rodentolepis nana]|uniref:Protein rolling stone n=1 Tax=Rodentolepis nana TaxID=102285 RepID=A0A0R3TU48_RODNA|nr:unnamed protein product [Rodentolepis nana]